MSGQWKLLHCTQRKHNQCLLRSICSLLVQYSGDSKAFEDQWCHSKGHTAIQAQQTYISHFMLTCFRSKLLGMTVQYTCLDVIIECKHKKSQHHPLRGASVAARAPLTSLILFGSKSSVYKISHSYADVCKHDEPCICHDWENPYSALKSFQTSTPITSRLMIICSFKQQHVFLAVTTSEQT